MTGQDAWMAYDFERKLKTRLPEMGGVLFLPLMGDGVTGTGKTTLIQMMAGLNLEYCGQRLSVPVSEPLDGTY